MNLSEIAKRARRLSDPYRIENRKFRLKDFDPDDTGELRQADRPEAAEMLAEGVQALSALQDRLYAQDRWSVLLIFQARDAAGKDSAIKHVMSGINPQGCQVYSFKAPSAEELDHDYMWRCARALPERGRIGIFNRSYYEEVLVVRVHRELLERQKIPPDLIQPKTIWEDRCEDMRNFERYLARNGTLILKFFLNVSRGEQRKRFLERVNKPEKNWKFSMGDVLEREFWGDYQRAYEEMIRLTASSFAPWYVVPADHKWFTQAVVASAIVTGLSSLELEYPALSAQQKAELARARRALSKG